MSENKKKNLELFVFVLTAAVHRSGSFKQWDTSAQDFSKTSRSENCCCAVNCPCSAVFNNDLDLLPVELGCVHPILVVLDSKIELFEDQKAY